MIAFLVVLIILGGIIGIIMLLQSSKKQGEEPKVISSGTGEDLISESTLNTAEEKEDESKTQAIETPSLVPNWARGVEKALSQPETLALPESKKRGAIARWLSTNFKSNILGLGPVDMQSIARHARKLGLPEDLDVLEHSRALDRLIQILLWQAIKTGKIGTKASESLIYKLLNHRQVLEMGRPRFRTGISSTRALSLGQGIKIMVPNAGMFKSRITQIHRESMEFELPRGRILPAPLQWKGLNIEVYFWRKDDAGYYFSSQVMNNPDSTMSPILSMQHSDELSRTQKRACLRGKVFMDALIVPLKSMAFADEKYDDGNGFRSRLIDISENGAAILVRGKIDPGFLVKVQTQLGGLPIVMPGEIKSVNVNEEKGFSVLHVEALPLSQAMKLRILAHVLQITQLDATLMPLHGGPAKKTSEDAAKPLDDVEEMAAEQSEVQNVEEEYPDINQASGGK